MISLMMELKRGDALPATTVIKLSSAVHTQLQIDTQDHLRCQIIFPISYYCNAYK